MFNVTKRYDLTASDLVRLKQTGNSVIKVPHIGNFSPTNLVCLGLRIKTVCYDRNIGCMDKNYHPHGIIARSKFEQVASHDSLMTHATVTHEVNGSRQHFPIGAHVADCHLNVLRRVNPSGDVILYTDYLARHKEFVLHLLALFSQVQLEQGLSWCSYVNPEGAVYERQCVSWQELREGIYGLTNLKEGWLIPKLFTILLCACIETFITQRKEVYFLSGGEMMKYIDDLIEPLDKVYSSAAEQNGLLSEIDFNLVGVGGLRFAVPLPKRPELDHLVSIYQQKLRLPKGDETRDHRRIGHELLSAVRKCPLIFFEGAKGKFFSQYDILGGEEMYAHPWMLDTPFSTLKGAIEEFRPLRTG